MDSAPKPVIVHLVTPYLFLTGSWIYSQLTGLEHFRNVVFSQRSEHRDRFPFKDVFTPDDFSMPEQLVNRAWRRATDRYGLFFEKTVRELKPSLFQAHLGYEGARWLGFVERMGLPLFTTFYGVDASKLGKIPSWQKRYEGLFDYGTAFLAEGSFLKRQLVDLGCPSDKIIIQHLGVELKKYPQKQFEGRKAKRRLILLQVSSFREKKGIQYSLEAVALLRKAGCEVEFRLIGSGDEPEAEERIRSLVLRLNIGDCVSLLGPRGHHETIEEMVKADIFLHPSVTAADGDNEGGAPVGIIEASAVGLPVVSTVHADIPEVVLDRVTGSLVPERDSVKLAEELSRLIQAPETMAAFGKAGREHIAENYNLTTQLQKLENIYASYLR
ncbi:MAG TPA: glycosyltransferase [Bacteroidota bacterium]|nr:glycosyltransferase [Bacteroidota bacterium]